MRRRGASFNLGEPLIRGGGQERGARAGTENVAAIAGFGAAARACLGSLAEEEARLLALRDRLADAVRGAAPDAVVFGETVPRLPNTLCFAVPGVEAATLMIALDLAGVAASSGSACSSGKVTPSHVLSAMGVRPELARCAIRLSLGWTSSDIDIERFVEAFSAALGRMRSRKKERRVLIRRRRKSLHLAAARCRGRVRLPFPVLLKESPWLASPSRIASTRSTIASTSFSWPAIAPAPFRPAPRSTWRGTTTRIPVVALREIGDGKLSPGDLREDVIHALQKHVEIDEPEAEAAPLMVTPNTQAQIDLGGEVQFDRMTEEDLLRGLEGLTPPPEPEEEAE